MRHTAFFLLFPKLFTFLVIGHHFVSVFVSVIYYLQMCMCVCLRVHTHMNMHTHLHTHKVFLVFASKLETSFLLTPKYFGMFSRTWICALTTRGLRVNHPRGPASVQPTIHIYISAVFRLVSLGLLFPLRLRRFHTETFTCPDSLLSNLEVAPFYLFFFPDLDNVEKHRAS